MFHRGGGLARPGSMIQPLASQTPAGMNRHIMRQRIVALGQDFESKEAAELEQYFEEAA